MYASFEWGNIDRFRFNREQLDDMKQACQKDGLLRTAMLFRVPWAGEIISSMAAMNGLSTGGSPSPCVGFSKQFRWRSWAIRTPAMVTVPMPTGSGGSPIGAQINFVHYRHVEPFLTRWRLPVLQPIECLEPHSSSTSQRNLVVVCSFSPPAAAPPLILDISITRFRTRIWEIKILGWTRIYYSSACRYFGREATVETPKQRSRGLAWRSPGRR